MLLLALPPTAYGHPVFGEVLLVREPDGSRIEVRVWGDEFYRVVESLDGYTLVRDPQSGAACYARLSPDGGTLVSTGVPVGSAAPGTLDLELHIRINPAARRKIVTAARARFAAGDAEVLEGLRLRGIPHQDPPNNGPVQGIVLLVDFSDDPGTVPASEIDNYCNQVGYTGYGNNGSVRDYFSDVSDGHLTYTNFVPPAYYRALHPKTYYTDPGIPQGTRARELVIEGLTDLEANGFDFSQYDANGDSLVDAVNCFYAGSIDNAWAEGLWPHSWSVAFSADGVSTYRYQITNIGSELRLRTFCHENGHMICYWPDLYDYGYESRGVGNFCLMCYGASNTNPAEPCAYFKYIAGWSTTTLLTTPQSGLPVQSGSNISYKYEHPTKEHEYYMIENRQQTARDGAIPDAGLAIWHIDTRGSNNNEQQTAELHYRVTLVQADGNWDLEHNVNAGDDTDLWSAPEHTNCAPTTDPNTHWWDGNVSGLAISDIGASDATMTFRFDLDCNSNGTPDEQDISGGASPDCNDSDVPDECELVLNDCNTNTIPDDCDIAGEESNDCNGNTIPDECDTTGAGVLLDEDFDNGLPAGWTINGDFQITDQCGLLHPDCGGDRWAYTGETATCTYGDYLLGELVAPPIVLGLGLTELQFCSRLDTELGWDWGRVYVDGILMWEDSGGSGLWEERVVDMRLFAGQTVTITFVFNSDTNTSGTFGWAVDNVYVTSGTPDCNSNGAPDECEVFGDVVTPFTWEPDAPQQPDLGDVICLLGDFADGPSVDGCSGSAYNTDLAPCGGDGVLDLNDLLNMLDAFAQIFQCPYPCP